MSVSRKVFTAVLALWALLPAPPSGAADGLEALEARLAAGATVGELAAYAYRVNPMIRAAKEEWRALTEKYRVDTAWDNPELMVEGMYMEDTLGRTGTPDDWKVTVNQAVPLPGKLGRAAAVAEADAKAARAKLDAAVRDVTVQLRESCWELSYLRAARLAAQKNRELLDQLRKAGETAYAGNRASFLDVTKAQAQSGQLGYDALLLAELEATEKTRVNGLLDRPPDAPLGPVEDEPLRPLAYGLEELYPLAEANLEELRIAQAGVEKAQAMLELTRYENLPEVKLGLSYGEQNLARQVGLQASFMLPVWPGKNAGRTGQAAADLERMRAMKGAQRNDLHTNLRETYFRFQASERLVHLYRDELIPQALKAVETAETWTRQGQGSFSDAVETQSALYSFQLALARATADGGKFLARLEKLAGRTLTVRAGEEKP